jgi:hypothetical protein
MNRPHSHHSAALQHRINAYALTATAAGVGFLALAPFADAKVVYTPAMVNLTGPHSFYQLDVNHDGVVDFSLSNAVTITTDQFFWQLLMGVPAGNSVVANFFYHGFPNRAHALVSGSNIGPGAAFYKSRAMLASVYYGGGGLSVHGDWIDVSNRYLGLKFQINGQTHFGWARLNVQINTTKLTVFSRITGYAYETTPNQAILAGQTHDDAPVPHAALLPPHLGSNPSTGADAPHNTRSNPLDAATVQSPTLAALALGVDGLALWRRDPEPGDMLRS